MTTKKKPSPEKIKEEPAFDADFRSFFGMTVTIRVAAIFRCSQCKGWIFPLRRHLWACEQPLCGKLIPDHVIDERLNCVIGPTTISTVEDIKNAVRGFARS